MGNLWIPMEEGLHKRFKDKYPKKMADTVIGWIIKDVGGSMDEISQRISDIVNEKQALIEEEEKLKSTLDGIKGKRNETIRELWPEFREVKTSKYSGWKTLEEPIYWWEKRGIILSFKEVYHIWDEMEGLL